MTHEIVIRVPVEAGQPTCGECPLSIPDEYGSDCAIWGQTQWGKGGWLRCDACHAAERPVEQQPAPGEGER